MDIGFLAPMFFTMENGSAAAMACAQIDRGSLEREVMAYLSTIPGGTATRKQKHNINFPLGINQPCKHIYNNEYYNVMQIT